MQHSALFSQILASAACSKVAYSKHTSLLTQAHDHAHIHALAGGGASAMDMDVATERALDNDADGGMLMYHDGDDGEVDPMGHVKGGRGATLYPAPELPHIREGRAQLKEMRREGVPLEVEAEAAGTEAMVAAVQARSKQYRQELEQERLMRCQQHQLQWEQGQVSDGAKEQELQALEHLCGQLNEAAAAEQEQAQPQQQQEQAADQPSAEQQGASSATKPLRVLQLYGFVIERTEQPSQELMGPLGVPIYDTEASSEQSSTAQPPCRWPKPPDGIPARAQQQQQSESMTVDGAEQQQQQQEGVWFTTCNADEVEPGWCVFRMPDWITTAHLISSCILSTCFLLMSILNTIFSLFQYHRRFHGSSAGPVFGHARKSWLHPYGMLLHQVLPTAALPPFR